MISTRTHSIKMEEITDPVALEEIKAQQNRFRRNSDWLQAHLATVYAQHRGKFICVSGEELFIGDQPEEVLARSRAAHPEDNGPLLRYIPRNRMERIYAH